MHGQLSEAEEDWVIWTPVYVNTEPWTLIEWIECVLKKKSNINYIIERSWKFLKIPLYELLQTVSNGRTCKLTVNGQI
ncbi:unnamed protein product [Rhizophagus irregularis]|nr:unnamed protein product [Rhizophagus irregularis]